MCVGLCEEVGECVIVPVKCFEDQQVGKCLTITKTCRQKLKSAPDVKLKKFQTAVGFQTRNAVSQTPEMTCLDLCVTL